MKLFSRFFKIFIQMQVTSMNPRKKDPQIKLKIFYRMTMKKLSKPSKFFKVIFWVDGQEWKWAVLTILIGRQGLFFKTFHFHILGPSTNFHSISRMFPYMENSKSRVTAVKANDDAWACLGTQLIGMIRTTMQRNFVKNATEEEIQEKQKVFFNK